MRRSRMAGVVLVVVVGTAVSIAARADGPELRFTDETPRDLRAVAERTWRRFSTAFQGRSDCLGHVTVGVAWDLPDRARYEPGPALILVRAPGTAANLEATMLHEFAHHAEHRCPMSTEFRRRFIQATGLPPSTPWRGGGRWDRVPSERFAEATVFYVLGGPSPHVLVRVSPGEVSAVAAWAARG